MTSEHISDEEIQEFVLNSAAAATGANEHIQHCALCKARVEAYELIIAAIVQEPAPILDFDISETVLATIEAQQQKSRNGWMYVLMAVGVLITGAVIYLFREDITALFKGVSAFIIYLLAITALFILIAMVVDQYKNHKNKMSLLDVYE